MNNQAVFSNSYYCWIIYTVTCTLDVIILTILLNILNESYKWLINVNFNKHFQEKPQTCRFILFCYRWRTVIKSHEHVECACSQRGPPSSPSYFPSLPSVHIPLPRHQLITHQQRAQKPVRMNRIILWLCIPTNKNQGRWVSTYL